MIISTMTPNDPKLTGEENYHPVFKYYGGLYRWWSCLEKAAIAKYYFKRGVVVIGSLTIYNSDKSATYSYEFNPPFEFHAWLQLGDNIFDAALYGAIEFGCKMKDEFGPILDIKPFVLHGKPDENITSYAPNQIIYR